MACCAQGPCHSWRRVCVGAPASCRHEHQEVPARQSRSSHSRHSFVSSPLLSHGGRCVLLVPWPMVEQKSGLQKTLFPYLVKKKEAGMLYKVFDSILPLEGLKWQNLAV